LTSEGKSLYQEAAVREHAKSDAVRAEAGTAVARTELMDAGRVGRSESAPTMPVAVSDSEFKLVVSKVGMGPSSEVRLVDVGVEKREELKPEPLPKSLQDPAVSEQSHIPSVSVPHQMDAPPQAEQAPEQVFPEPQMSPPPLSLSVQDPVESEQSHDPLLSVPHQM
jgi:hypothetical protein